MFHQFNVTGQWEFRPNWLAEVGYVGSRGRNLLVVRNIGNQGSGFPGSRQVTTHSIVQTVEYNGESNVQQFAIQARAAFQRRLVDNFHIRLLALNR